MPRRSDTTKKKAKAPAGKARGRAPRKKAGTAPALPFSKRVAEDLLAALTRLSPPVQQVVVEHPDPTMNFKLLRLAEVVYITTKVDVPGRSTMLVTVQGERFYSQQSLSGWMKKLEAGNPWFLRTHESYVVNLGRITGIRYGSARDLWFEGHPDPVVSAVSDSYRAVFDARVGL